MNINEIKSKYQPDQKAQEAIWMHGLASADSLQKLEELIKNKPLAEICCTGINDGTQAFQNFGVYVKGEVTLMMRDDIGSKYDQETGERSFICDDISDDLLNKFCVKNYDDLKPIVEGKGYTESFVRPKEIIGVWVYKNMLERKDARAKILQRKISAVKEMGYSVTLI